MFHVERLRFLLCSINTLTDGSACIYRHYCLFPLLLRQRKAIGISYTNPDVRG